MVVLVAIALALAMVGTAVAGPESLKATITKAKVKKIAKRQIAKAAPGLAVGSAAAADSAYARALIRTDPLQVTLARNIAQSQVDSPSPGYVCLDLDFVPVGIQVTKETDGLNDTAVASATIDPNSRVMPRGGTFNRCEPGTDILVVSELPTGNAVAVDFFIEVAR
jgi:hypothetical protein